MKENYMLIWMVAPGANEKLINKFEITGEDLGVGRFQIKQAKHNKVKES
jgi:hypothetical protein